MNMWRAHRCRKLLSQGRIDAVEAVDGVVPVGLPVNVFKAAELPTGKEVEAGGDRELPKGSLT